MKRGIRWSRTTGEIAALNAKVDSIVSTFINEQEQQQIGETVKASKISTLNGSSPEVLHIIKYKTKVYKERLIFIPPLFAIGSLLVLLYHAFVQTTTTMVAIVCMFLYYDFFSGVLHVVLDEPSFIGFPILGDPCLEFQWHHHVPNDLAQKSFLEVCGDLNLVLTLIMIKDLIVFRGTNPLSLCLLASKVLMAYFGQLCHCMSHTPKSERPHWVIALQDAGLMLSSREHMIHHIHYDDNFCIGSGIFNPTLKLMHGTCSNKWVWLALFLTLAIVDVYAFDRLFFRVFGMV